MSKREEKQTPIALLKDKLRALGFEKDPAAKYLLTALAPAHISGDLVDAVNNMVSIAANETKKRCKKAMQETIDTL